MISFNFVVLWIGRLFLLAGALAVLAGALAILAGIIYLAIYRITYAVNNSHHRLDHCLAGTSTGRQYLQVLQNLDKIEAVIIDMRRESNRTVDASIEHMQYIYDRQNRWANVLESVIKLEPRE